MLALRSCVMHALAIVPRTSSSPSLASPVSGVRFVSLQRVPSALAELHAVAHHQCHRSLEALAKACTPLEESLKVRPPSMVIAIESRSALPAIDLEAGLFELLGPLACMVTPVASIREAARSDRMCDALAEVGRLFPLSGLEFPRHERLSAHAARVEVVTGETFATVDGYVLPVTPQAPSAGTRVVVGARSVSIENAPREVVEWIDRLAYADDAQLAVRTVALSMVLLEKAPEAHVACVAAALVDVAGAARASLAANDLGDDHEGRALTCALRALSVAEQVSDDVETLRVIAAAAMLQPKLEALSSVDDARAWLAELVQSDPTLGLPCVVAHQAIAVRRGAPAEAASMHARLVAMACDPLPPGDEPIELADSDLERVSVSRRDSLELPDPNRAQGKTRLAVTPLAQILAVSHDRRLSGTLVVIEPSGVRHAMVLSGGCPIRVRHRTSAVILDADLDTHLARITAIASADKESRVEFYAGCDLLVGLLDAPFVACEAQAGVLAAARASSVRSRLRELVIDFSTSRTLRLLPTQLPNYAPTEREAAAAASVLFDAAPVASLGDALDTAVPLLAATHFLRELKVV